MNFYQPGHLPPDRSIGFLLRVCNQLGLAQLDQAFAADGISVVQWSALVGIHLNERSTCATLARDMVHDKGAMTRMIDTLEARGLVTRQRDAHDRRLVNLSLTAEGEAVTRRCRERATACWNGWLAGWSEQEANRFITQLQKLRHRLEGHPTCAA